MDEPIKTPETKRIDFDKGKFEANGQTYFINPVLTLTRYEIYDRMSVSTGFGLDFSGVFGKFKEIYETCTNGNDMLRAINDAANISYNAMSEISEYLKEEKSHPVLQICTLFFNRTEEDISEYDPRLAEEKIEDWKAEGYAMESFFLFVASAVKDLTKSFQYMDQEIQKEEQRKKSKAVKASSATTSPKRTSKKPSKKT